MHEQKYQVIAEEIQELKPNERLQVLTQDVFIVHGVLVQDIFVFHAYAARYLTRI